MGQLIERVRSPVTAVFEVEDDPIRMNERISFPLRPMLGVVGVATDGETIGNGFAGRHGGNLDNHLHGPGAKIYLPVRRPGGMFATGDMHASMGDGEICFTGVEIAGEATIRFDLVKGKQATWPVTELADRWVAHGTHSPQAPESAPSRIPARGNTPEARPLRDRGRTETATGPSFMEALDRAAEEAQRLLVDEWGFSPEEAFIFLSVACDARICQACRPQEFSTIARIEIPKLAACPQPFRSG